MRIPLVYIAGPFRAGTHWGVHCNVIAAEKLSLKVACAGGFPVCPHKNTENFHGLLTDEFWLDGTATLMGKCDAVVTVDNWEGSAGTTDEIHVAQILNIPVFHGTMNDARELQEWVYRFQRGGSGNE